MMLRHLPHPAVAARLLILWCTFMSSGWAGPGAHGPDGEHLHIPSAATGDGLARLPDGSVHVPKLAQRRMQIRTVVAPMGEHPRTVLLTGRVVIDPRWGGRVQAPIVARVSPPAGGMPLPGQVVRQGQVLAWLEPLSSAAERAAQQVDLVRARASLSAVERRVARLVQLEGSVPRKDIEAAQAELQALRGQERALSQSLGGREAVTAPSSGVLTGASVLPGQVVQAGDVLFDVVHPERAMIEADTTDPGLGPRIGAASLTEHPGVRLRFAGASRTLRNGRLPLTFTAETRSAPLAIGQPVTVAAALNEAARGVAVPAEAVVRNAANEPVVWIKAGAERFVQQPVQTQVLDATQVLVTRGLAPDNRVVVQGAALINQIR